MPGGRNSRRYPYSGICIRIIRSLAPAPVVASGRELCAKSNEGTIMSTLNQTEQRQFAAMAFRVTCSGDWSRAAMYDRPKFIATDAAVSVGEGKTERDAKLDAFLQWSRQ